MKYQQHEEGYIIRLMAGEELFDCITKFCKEKDIHGASFRGIGGTNDIDIGVLDPEKQEYIKKNFTDGQFEITSILGNVAQDKLHIHVTIAGADYKSYGGHCLRAVCTPTMEIVLKELHPMEREMDLDSGLPLLNLEQTFE